MLGDAEHFDLHIFILALGGRAVVGDFAQHLAHIAAEGLVVVVLFLVFGELQAHRLDDFVEGRKTVDLPLVLAHLLDLVFRFLALFVEVADKELDEIVQRDDAVYAAVFVEDDRKVFARRLHAVEKIVRLHGLGDEHGIDDRLFFDVFGRFIVEAEVNLRIEHARHVVDVLAADGVEGMIALFDGLFPDGRIVALEEEVDVLPVRAHFADVVLLEVEDVLDELVLLLVDGALLAARFRHEHDLFFGDFLALIFGLDAEEAQNAVRGRR